MLYVFLSSACVVAGTVMAETIHPNCILIFFPIWLFIGLYLSLKIDSYKHEIYMLKEYNKFMRREILNRGDYMVEYSEDIKNGFDPRNNGCLCQRCGRRYKVDLIFPDDFWEKIRGNNNTLCPICIGEAIEKLNEFDHWYITKNIKAMEE